jgi:hypothetical protein
MKHQIPSTKFQTNPNARNSKFQTLSRFAIRGIRIWILEFVWDLDIGAWNLNFLISPSE